MNRLFTISLLFIAFLQAMAKEPIVTTDTRFARGATMAFGRATLKANGTIIQEAGFCWSAETKEPTVNDNVTKTKLTNNGAIYWMKNLQPATKYYARAYAKTTTGSVSYGETIKIITLPKGTISWGYDNGGSTDENTRINSAVASCVDYWNNLTSISDLYLNVHYGASTPTADCSYGGWMRVGPNSSYQRTGTVMHEALHAIGVGTHSLWNGSASPLRSGSGTGQWLGDRATEVVRFWDNTTTGILNGDVTHFWPYGINGANEDTGTDVLYIGNSLLAQAVCEDGLPPTTSHNFGLPYYSFDQEDDVKYYIKNESGDYGLYTSFLVEDANHNLKWQTMTVEEAQKNDAAAWFVTFSPNNQYYQLRNASTRYYMTYQSAGVDGIRTVQRTTPTGAENFQLMRSRIDIKTPSGSVVTPQRGYWVIHPDNSSATPGCLEASSDGATTVQPFDISDNKQKQRWVICTATQVSSIEENAGIVARDVFVENKNIVETLALTPHRELSAGADKVLAETIADLSAKCNVSKVASEILGYASDVMAAGKAFLAQVVVTDIAEPFDLTPFLDNPTFANGTDGWTMGTGATYDYGEVEFYQTTASATQKVAAMPKGSYTMKVQAFQRPGSYTDVYNAYSSGTDGVTVKIWLQSTTYGSKLIKNLMADRSAKLLHSGDKQMVDGTYVPDNMASAAVHFTQGALDNEVTSYIPETGDLNLYLRGTNSLSSSWTCLDNFRLYYYGPLTLDDITAVKNIETQADTVTATSVYSLDGRLMGSGLHSLPAGVYIQNHKKIKKN